MGPLTEAGGRIVAPPMSYIYPAHFKSELRGILHCFVWASFAILLSLFWATRDDHGRKHKHALKHVDGCGRQQQLCSWRTTGAQSHTGTSKHSTALFMKNHRSTISHRYKQTLDSSVHEEPQEHNLTQVQANTRQLCSWRTTWAQSHTGTSKHSRNNAVQHCTLLQCIGYKCSTCLQALKDRNFLR